MEQKEFKQLLEKQEERIKKHIGVLVESFDAKISLISPNNINPLWKRYMNTQNKFKK